MGGSQNHCHKGEEIFSLKFKTKASGNTDNVCVWGGGGLSVD